LIAMSFHTGVSLDGLACPMRRPMACNHQMRGHGFLLGAVLSYRATMGSGALLGDTQPPGLDVHGAI
jgi:hypothetical protein